MNPTYKKKSLERMKRKVEMPLTISNFMQLWVIHHFAEVILGVRPFQLEPDPGTLNSDNCGITGHLTPGILGLQFGSDNPETVWNTRVEQPQRRSLPNNPSKRKKIVRLGWMMTSGCFWPLSWRGGVIRLNFILLFVIIITEVITGRIHTIADTDSLYGCF